MNEDVYIYHNTIVIISKQGEFFPLLINLFPKTNTDYDNRRKNILQRKTDQTKWRHRIAPFSPSAYYALDMHYYTRILEHKQLTVL